MIIETNALILILGTLVTVVMGIIGVKLVSTRHVTPEYQQDKLKNLQLDYDDLKKENKYLRGKVTQVRQKFKIDDDVDLDNDGDLVSLAKSILPAISEILPKDVQKHIGSLISNPDIIELFNEIHKKYPEETKQLLGGFLKKSKSDSGNQVESEASQALALEGGA